MEEREYEENTCSHPGAVSVPGAGQLRQSQSAQQFRYHFYSCRFYRHYFHHHTSGRRSGETVTLATGGTSGTYYATAA